MEINARNYNSNETIKFIRQGLNETQKAMAKKIGISESSLRKYELGIVNYTFETLLRIAKEYNLEIIIKEKK